MNPEEMTAEEILEVSTRAAQEAAERVQQEEPVDSVAVLREAGMVE